MVNLPDPTDPLNEPCSECGRPIGDHTMRDWQMHNTVGGMQEMPFEDVDGAAGLGVDLSQICDTLDVRSLTAETAIGTLGLVELHWQVGNPFGQNRSLAKVLFMGSPDSLRAAGRLLRDAMNRSANVVERSA